MSTRRLAPPTLVALVLAGLVAAAAAPAVQVTLPRIGDSVRFAVIGDSGTGDRPQYEVAQRLVEAHEQFPFTFVLMMGDNLYGSERPQDYARKFEAPYQPLLDAGIEFHAVLGNHDDPSQRLYKPFNMNGERYYAFEEGPVKFLALDSNYLDRKQLDWLRQELEGGPKWKIAYFHHPPYSSGRTHGSETDLREIVEPLFVQYGVSAVFSGHEHFYERVKPQNGITYFISGAAAKLRAGDIRKTPLTAAGYDRDRSFMLVEIAGDALYFQTISRTGETVDSGTVPRRDPSS